MLRGDDALWLVGAVAVIVGSILVTPAQEGYGTHQKLFLPPCYFRLLTRVKCPLCGMTTSLCHIARGELVATLRAIVLGPLVALFVAAQIPFRASRLLGRPLRLPRWCHGNRPPWVLLSVLLAAWPINVCLQFCWH